MSLVPEGPKGTWNIDTVDGIFQNVVLLIPLGPARPAAGLVVPLGLVSESLTRIGRSLQPPFTGQMHIVVACTVSADERYQATFPARRTGTFHHHARILMARGWAHALRRDDGDEEHALLAVSAELRHMAAETPGSPAWIISRLLPQVDATGGTFIPLAEPVGSGSAQREWNGSKMLSAAIALRFTP